ncbi:hypothetical protein ACFXPJ_25195 [Streptomyces goshikiensis]
MRALRALIEDGTGSIRPELLPFFDALRRMRRPQGALPWTNKLHSCGTCGPWLAATSHSPTRA